MICEAKSAQVGRWQIEMVGNVSALPKMQPLNGAATTPLRRPHSQGAIGTR